MCVHGGQPCNARATVNVENFPRFAASDVFSTVRPRIIPSARGKIPSYLMSLAQHAALETLAAI